MTPLYAKILELASRRGGMRTLDIDAFSSTTVGNACHKLKHKGELFQVRFSRGYVRWYRTLAQAQAEAVNNPNTIAAGATYEIKPTVGSAAQWGPDDEAIVPPHVEVQICPRYEPRYQGLVDSGPYRSL